MAKKLDVSTVVVGTTAVVLGLLAGCGVGTPVGSSTEPPSLVDMPIFSVTPGQVLTTDPADFCTTGWSSAHRRELTAAQKRTLRAAYGLTSDAPVAEWDHLVPLELGGDNGPANVWPQVDPADRARKDRFENAEHRAVCAMKSETATQAQRRAVQYWLYW